MKHQTFFIYLSIVLSITAIALSCFYPKPIALDMFNSVVTVLSLLIAILLGWQIVTIINFRDEKSDFEKIKQDFKSEMEMQVFLASKSRLLINESLFNFFVNQQKDYEVFLYGLDTIALSLDNKIIVENIIIGLKEYSKNGITFNFEFQKREIHILFFSFYKSIEPIVLVDDLELLRERITVANVRG